MKKNIALITTSLALVALAGCDGVAEPHEHTFKQEWETNETHHWHNASCEHTDLVKDLNTHNFGDGNVCNDCGYTKPAPVVEHEHTFATGWTHDETNHWHAATCEHTDLTSGLEAHDFGDGNVCKDCGYEKPAPVVPHEHTFATDWTYDETNHWHAASCEHNELISGLAAHNYGVDNICDDCGYEKPAPVIPHEHAFATDWTHDETNHWHAATCEHTTLTNGLAEHNFGGDNICDDCGYEKPAPVVPHEHTFATSWTHDETNHWHAATCEHTDLTSDLEAHNFGDDNICDDCEYVKPAPAHEHTFSSEWSKDETNHWHAATCEHTEMFKGLELHDFGDDNICDTCGFVKSTKYYSVIWKNYDGEILEIDYNVEEGTVPTCDVTPSKDDGAHVFNFKGWAPEVGPITQNMVFTAVIEQDMTQKLVIFEDDLGNELNRQLVMVGDEPDLTLFNYKGIIVGDKVKVLTGWNQPVGKIYEDTTFVGSYETYDKTIEALEINNMLSREALGTNSAFDLYSYQNSLLSYKQHISIANRKYKLIYEFSEANPRYGDAEELYMEEGYRYHYELSGGDETATIRKYEETPLFGFDITDNVSAFTQDTDFTFDLETGLFVANGASRKVYLSLKEGKVHYMKSAMYADIDAQGVATSYEELYMISLGEVEPFEIPDYNYTGLDKYTITFNDAEGNELSVQNLYDGMMPDTSKISIPEKEITEDKIIEFVGWDKEIVGACENATYTAVFAEYKKTYTASEMAGIVSFSNLGSNFSYDYSYESDTEVSWVKHIAVANGLYKEITEPNEPELEASGKYLDGIYSYDYLKLKGKDVRCQKSVSSRNIEQEVNTFLGKYLINVDYVYNQSLDMFCSANSTRTVWIKLKNGKPEYLKTELKGLVGFYDVTKFTNIGGVEPFEIPDYDWEEDVDPIHEHVYDTKWSTDANNHWHQAICVHTDLQSEFAPHSFGNDNICDVCGYVATVHIHSFSTEWSADETKHWHASTCGHDYVEGLSNHTYGDDNLCTVCGYKKIEKHTITYANWPDEIENPNPTDFVRTDDFVLDGSTIEEKEGFSNVKFFVGSNEVTTLTGIDEDVTVNVTYDAAITKFTVVPDNEEDESLEIDVPYWSILSDLIDEYSRSEHDFVGWFDDEGNQIDLNERWESLEETFTITAKWNFKGIDKYVRDIEDFEQSLIVEAAKVAGSELDFEHFVEQMHGDLKSAKSELLVKEYTKAEADGLYEKHTKVLNTAAVSYVVPKLNGAFYLLFQQKSTESPSPERFNILQNYYNAHSNFASDLTKPLADIVYAYQVAMSGLSAL